MVEREHLDDLLGRDVAGAAFSQFVEGIWRGEIVPPGAPGPLPEFDFAAGPPPKDPVLRAFLERQLPAGIEFAAQSDIVDLEPVPSVSGPPRRYLARFHCTSAIETAEGEIVPTSGVYRVGIAFPSDYLRRVHPLRVAVMLSPPAVFHPNIAAPRMCIGHVPPGFPLVDLMFHVFEILTFNKWASHDYLNGVAAAWARQHQAEFPLDRRPLKRRALRLVVEPKVSEAKNSKTQRPDRDVTEGADS